MNRGPLQTISQVWCRASVTWLRNNTADTKDGTTSQATPPPFREATRTNSSTSLKDVPIWQLSHVRCTSRVSLPCSTDRNGFHSHLERLPDIVRQEVAL